MIFGNAIVLGIIRIADQSPVKRIEPSLLRHFRTEIAIPHQGMTLFHRHAGLDPVSLTK